MNDITRPVPKQTQQSSSQLPAVLPNLDTPQQPMQPPQKPSKRAGLWVLGILGFLFVVIIGLAVFGYLWYVGALKPVSTEMDNTSFKVVEGASVEQIANGLEEEGLVQSSLATQLFMRLNNQTNIKAGTYVLSPSQSVSEITSWLNEGRTDTLRVTILPGRTIKKLTADLVKYGYKQADVEAALTKDWDHPLLSDKPANVNLEGYVYPETYFMEASSTPEDLIRRSFDEFEAQINAGDLRKKLADRGFNLHQGITLASIISGEVPSNEDQRKVSQVFQTRLSDGMMLGSDVTYVYAAELLSVESSPSIDSVYNTRKYQGLPPGAVGNFNLPALEAVVNPANTTYLFFVAGDDGVTHYSYTFAEHEDNIAKYCHKACLSN